MTLRRTKKYVCTECDHRDVWRQFGMFVRCPQCGSDSIACAEIWDRFGPGNNQYGSGKEKGGGVDGDLVAK